LSLGHQFGFLVELGNQNIASKFNRAMTALALARLTNRKLLKITGPDCYPYLQGLLCNDVRYLYEPDRIPERKHAKNSSNAMGAFMLNAHGKAICDILLYRTALTRQDCVFTPPGQAYEHDELLIECDSSLASGLANTLYGYRLRRKIRLSIENELTTWCLFPKLVDNHDSSALASFEERISVLSDVGEIIGDGLTIVNDPRILSMGMRIISKTTDFIDLKSSIQSITNQDILESTLKDYTIHRYMLGVGEGGQDHPESNCFPLECNADLLGSVSYDKGCYLGQELTARIHFTGVVRKRLMPITLDTKIDLRSGTEIVDSNGKRLGLLRKAVGNRGLALMRHELAIASQDLVHEETGTKISTQVPYWWH